MPKTDHVRMFPQYAPDDVPFDSAAFAVNDPNLVDFPFEAGANKLQDHFPGVGWREQMQIDRTIDRVFVGLIRIPMDSGAGMPAVVVVQWDSIGAARALPVSRPNRCRNARRPVERSE